MSYCLNPQCHHPRNPLKSRICQTCGASLLLKERYRAIKPIARGGFGKTYLAVDEDRLNTLCVIKQFLPKLQGTVASRQATLHKAIELFNQEALRLYELGVHPQIPSLLASFEQDKRLYLVQEFIDGKTLWHELKDRGAFAPSEILALLRDILPVLAFVHQKKVVHRDITPANILRRKEDGFLVLIDFGVAKQLSQTSLAKTGTKVGTASYAPIEQLRSGKAYPASDLYSLGVTCIHLLTAVKPDALFDPLKGCIWREYLKSRGRDISDRFGDVLDRMIADRVTDRYQSAEAVLQDLAAVGVSPTQTRNATVAPPTGKPPASPPITTPSSTSPMPSRPPRTGDRSQSASRLDPCLRTLTGHGSWVTCLAIDPGGKLLASGSLDDTIAIWNFRTGERLRTLRGHSKSINALAISPDGTLLASCSDDDTIALWQLNTGTRLATFDEHLRDVNAVAFATQGHLLISGSEDRTIKLWPLGDRASQTPAPSPYTLSGRSGMIKAIATNHTQLVSGGLDKTIHVWNIASRQVIYNLSGHFQAVNTLAISPDGTLLASGSKDKTIKLWNLSTGTLLSTLSNHLDSVNSLAFSPDGKTLVSGSSDQTLKLWQLDPSKPNSATLQTTFTGHFGAVNAVLFTPSGKMVVSGSWDETIKIWRVGR